MSGACARFCGVLGFGFGAKIMRDEEAWRAYGAPRRRVLNNFRSGFWDF